MDKWPLEPLIQCPDMIDRPRPLHCQLCRSPPSPSWEWLSWLALVSSVWVKVGAWYWGRLETIKGSWLGPLSSAAWRSQVQSLTPTPLRDTKYQLPSVLSVSDWLGPMVEGNLIWQILDLRLSLSLIWGVWERGDPLIPRAWAKQSLPFQKCFYPKSVPGVYLLNRDSLWELTKI